MNDPITWQQIVTGITVVGGLGALWFRIESAIGKVRDDLAAYKLTVANSYAQDKDIRDVEIRVLANISNVAQELSRLRESIEKVLTAMATQRGET